MCALATTCDRPSVPAFSIPIAERPLGAPISPTSRPVQPMFAHCATAPRTSPASSKRSAASFHVRERGAGLAHLRGVRPAREVDPRGDPGIAPGDRVPVAVHVREELLGRRAEARQEERDRRARRGHHHPPRRAVLAAQLDGLHRRPTRGARDRRASRSRSRPDPRRCTTACRRAGADPIASSADVCSREGSPLKRYASAAMRWNRPRDSPAGPQRRPRSTQASAASSIRCLGGPAPRRGGRTRPLRSPAELEKVSPARRRRAPRPSRATPRRACGRASCRRR